MSGLSRLAPLALALVVSCGGTAAAAPPVRVSAPATDLIFLVNGGIEEPLVPGERVPLAGELTARFILRPGDGPGRRVLEIELASGGNVEEGAAISAAVHMRYMDHGSFTAVALPDGPGHYVMALPFAMAGDWEVELTIKTTATRTSVPLALSVVR